MPNESSLQIPEKRKLPRIPVCLRLVAECSQWTEMCFTKDISQIGAFVISPRLSAPGDQFTLSICLPADMGVLRCRARVVRVQEEKPAGMAVAFMDLDQDQQVKLERIVQLWLQAFPACQQARRPPERCR